MKRPNILLIMADQFRGDCLGVNGHPDVKTPYLDALAMNGVNFTKAYTACPSCVPARAALFTGMGQKNHKRVSYDDAVPWEYPNLLAGELSKVGYYTQAVGKMHVYPVRNNCGFHNVELHDGYMHYIRNPNVPYYEHQQIADDYFYWLKDKKGLLADLTDGGLECNSWLSRPWQYEEELHPTNWVASRSVDFLRRRDRSKPFFLFASFVRPHSPFDAPQHYFDMYNNMQLSQSPVGEWAEENNEYRTAGNTHNSMYMSTDTELARQSKVGYYACITHLDHQIGRLWQAIVDDGELRNTFIIFVSDHGEMMGDHHMFRKSVPYEGSARIPFIIQPHAGFDFAGAGSNRGTVVDEIVELRDVMPTLLDIAQAEIPESVDGISLLDIMRRTEGATREYIHGEHELGERSNHYIVTKRDKYIWYSQTGLEQYFDLESDPSELLNKTGDINCKDRIEKMRGWLIDELTGREEGFIVGGELASGKKYNYVWK